MKTAVDIAALQPMNIISNNNFEAEILTRDKPVLLMCVPGGRVYAEQVRVLEQLSDRYRKMVNICCLEEDFINGFKKMYNIKGTPVFLLFYRGQEIGRMLGMTDKERLEAFLDRNLPPTSANKRNKR
ncbi:MAG: thioredoxin family protein [Thermodesulfobacteriota bacterium]